MGSATVILAVSAQASREGINVDIYKQAKREILR
jgi:hypothetical protein